MSIPCFVTTSTSGMRAEGVGAVAFALLRASVGVVVPPSPGFFSTPERCGGEKGGGKGGEKGGEGGEGARRGSEGRVRESGEGKEREVRKVLPSKLFCDTGTILSTLHGAIYIDGVA